MATPHIFIVSQRNDLFDHLFGQFPNSFFKTVSTLDTIQNSREVIVQCVIFDKINDPIQDPASEVLIIQGLRRLFTTCFIVIFDPTAAYNPRYRLRCFDNGCNMVAHDLSSLVSTLSNAVILSPFERGARKYTCPYCHLTGLTENELWIHAPTYHINNPNSHTINDSGCPICYKSSRRSLLVHIHDKHGPIQPKKSSVTQLYSFSLVICRHPVTGLYLLCQEFANQGFWLPGGGVDDGETLTDAALRETMEEAGMKVDLKGILSIEYNPVGLYDSQSSHDSYLVRMRVIFYAEPTIEYMDKLPKSSPDFESVGACWCSADDILADSSNSLKLRGNEPRQWVRYLRDGGSVYPLSILRQKEG